MLLHFRTPRTFFPLLPALLLAVAIDAQTSTLTYQGRLTDGSAAANGAYQMRFTLMDSAAGGAPVGTPIEDVPVTVTNGVFTVMLDFGAPAFASGANRFLEIEVRRVSGEPYIMLNPRQQITSSPYSIRTISAQTADSVAGQTSLNTPNTVVARDGSGNFAAGVVTTSTNLGTANPNIAFGQRFRDNGIVAWARVSGSGTLVNSFGIASVVRNDIGSYTVTTRASGALIPVAVAEIDTRPLSTSMRIVSVNVMTANTFQVFINNGAGSAADGEFLVIVTGR